MEDAQAVQQEITAQSVGRGCLPTATASSKKRRPGQMLRAFAMAKVVTWLLLPTKGSTTTSTERMHLSGWEGRIKREKGHGDGPIAVPGGLSSGASIFFAWVLSVLKPTNNPTMALPCTIKKIVFSYDIGMTTSGTMLCAVSHISLSAP